MMQTKRICHKNERLAAWLLLFMFMGFSIQLPLLNKEVYTNNHITGYVLIGLQDSITTSSVYHAPVAKHDFSTHRTVALFCFKPGGWSLPGAGDEPKATQKQPAGIHIPLSTIPTYLFERVLRI